MTHSGTPEQVELCQRPRELGRPCLGRLYRPQPDTVYCYTCGGKEPGVVYQLGGQLLEDATMVLRLLDQWVTLQDTWDATREIAPVHQAGEALVAGLRAFRTHHPTALTGKE